MNQNKVIIITGGIACGKSTVTDYLRQKDYVVISTDNITHDLYENDERIYFQLMDLFSDKILDDQKKIDRIKLGKIVFSNEEKRKALEDITHTAIIDRVRKLMDHLTFVKKNVIFIEIPLYEKTKVIINQKLPVIAVWFITCDEKLQIQRLMERGHFSQEDALQRIKAQKEENPTFDYMISNNGPTDELFRKVQNLLDKEKL